MELRYRVQYMDEVALDFDALPKRAQAMVVSGIHGHLAADADRETRNRKSLRPNDLAAWELRLGDYRVFYDVFPEERTVVVKAVGWKVHSRLHIRGREFLL
ncbi:MAG TPA: type II toxin-antitoxin system RelE/ParE family toxin [Planctomycetota bacterium]|nr:type II toxin-antitoxin system RelE/ParE family toxin [Planctomycetota bacterium]